MTLAAGSRLGPYEILAPLGAGGMGEVYSAKDTRLERTVAIKVLPQHLSVSPETRQRFEREAKTISQLSHAHICALYDVGREGDTEYLVMEYLEGETLTDRLGKGALPLEQTLRYGTEIADALDKAHRQGIVHRDLKPGNVMITKAGVKLLDFGLAKAMAAPVQPSGMTSLPTVMGAGQNLTQEGTILGTFQYMAPEQLEGKEADARSDIFAFGAVLYEMATGRKAFSGASQASLISAIMKEDPPPVSAVQAMSPPALDRVVKTCLSKDPEDRWQSARDVGNELKWIAQGSQAGVPARVSARRRGRERAAWILATAASALAAVLAAAFLRRGAPPATPVRASIVLPEKAFAADLVASPDGSRLAFTATDASGQAQLWIRELDAAAARPVGGSEGARFPFWSPDGRFVAFFADRKLLRADAKGGSTLTICDAENGVGGTWNAEGTILFAPSATSGLFRVAATGGKPVAVTTLDVLRHEAAHRYPQFLPDGRHFLFTATGLGGSKGEESNAIRVASLEGDENRPLLGLLTNVVYASGYLLYVRDQTLFAQRFHPTRRVLEGEAIQIAAPMVRTTDWAGYYAFTAAGRALFWAQRSEVPSRLTWFDRSGKPLGTVGEPNLFGPFRLSPDESRIAATVSDPSRNKADIWIFDSASGAATKLVGTGTSFAPVWSADGSRVFFALLRDESDIPQIWVKPIDGSKERPYAEGADNWSPWDWSRDGRSLAVLKVPLHGKRFNEIWVLDASDPKHASPFSVEAQDQGEARFSPDSKWIAFSGNETGIYEVYVRPLSGSGGEARKISSGGGFVPKWRADGKEIFYMTADNRIMALPVTLEPEFRAGTPARLFSVASSSAFFEVSRDGQRFLVNETAEGAASPPVNLLLNWAALLEKK